MTPFKENITDSIDNLNSLINRVNFTGEKFDAVYTSEENIDNMLENNVDSKSGSDVTINNTVAGGKFDWEIQGSCEQDTNVITYTCLGTETGTYDFTYNEVKYYFTMPTISAGDVLYFNTDTLKLYKGETEITTASSGAESTTITMVATPNPNYPQSVRVVTGDNEVVVQNKNLFVPHIPNSKYMSTVTLDDDEFTFIPNSSNAYVGEVTAEGGSYSSSRGLLINIPNIAEKLYVYINNDVFDRIYITWFDEDKISLGYNLITSNSGNLTIPSGAKYFQLRWCGATYEVGTAYKLKIDVEIQAISEYTKHQSQTLPIHLSTNYLAGIGDYADTIEGTKDNWKIVRQIEKIVYNGTESWTKWSLGATNVERFYHDSATTIFSNLDLFNQLSYALGNNDNEHWRFSSGSYVQGELIIFINKDRLSEVSANGLKSYLSNNNLIGYSRLRTPTEETITDTTLISDLNNMYDLMGYDGQTNISIVPDTGNSTPSLKVTGFVTVKEV